MKKISLLVFILVIIQLKASSQSCLPEGITFTTQTQIDSFQVNYPGCIVIEGDVYVGIHVGGSNINNLVGLNVLKSVDGNFSIRREWHVHRI